MWSNVVVVVLELLCERADFIKRFKHVAIQDFGPARSIEAFDEGILGRFSRLDKAQFDAVIIRPFF